MLPLNTHKNNYVFGRGKIYVDLFDAQGKKTGERFLGNTPGFTLSVAIEKYEHFSSTSGLKRKDLSLVTSVNFSGKITVDDVSYENLALFLGGSVSTVTQAAAAVSDEEHTVRAGYEYQLGTSDLNPVGVKGVSAFSLKSADGATTYDADDDYIVDPKSGRFAIVAGGAIVDGTKVHAGYTPTAGTRTRVATTGAGQQIGAVRFIADNAVGENRDCYIPSSSLAASGDMSMITENDISKFDLDVGINERDSATPQILIDGELVTGG